MKKLLLPLLLIMALPVLAQRNETGYRISRIFSAECGEEELFFYNDEADTQPCCIKRTSELHDYESIDSLFYNDLGQLTKKCYYIVYEYPYLELSQILEFSYNDKGQRTICDIYSDEDLKEGFIDYTYDDNGRLYYMTSGYTYDEWSEKVDFTYNENDLIIEITYSSRYGSDTDYVAEEKMTFEYNDNNSLTKQVYYYVDGEELYNEGEYIYEYDEYNNCVSMTEYYYDEIESKTEYLHDLQISSETVHTYIDYEDDFYSYVQPTHSNMVIEAITYRTDENYDFYVDCEYLYKYDELSVSLEENDVTFNVYPNPANDMINIEAQDIELVELYDIYGRMLYSEDINDNTSIDISDFAEGIYFIKIYSEGKNSVKKIIKK